MPGEQRGPGWTSACRISKPRLVVDRAIDAVTVLVHAGDVTIGIGSAVIVFVSVSETGRHHRIKFAGVQAGLPAAVNELLIICGAPHGRTSLMAEFEICRHCLAWTTNHLLVNAAYSHNAPPVPNGR